MTTSRSRPSCASCAATLAAAAMLAIPGAVGAQAVCKPAAATTEARMLAFFATPLAFAAHPGAPLALGQFALAGELTSIPRVPAELNVSSGACGFVKSENSGLAPVLPRPRLAIGIGRGLVAELSWLPPVTVADATPHLGGVALSWTPSGVRLPFDAALTLRAHATLGGIDGPVTCPRSALQVTNSQQDCFGRNPSNDTYNPNVRGVEVLATRRSGAALWYAGAGVNAVGARFRVNFTDERGFTDRNIVEIALVRAALFGGASWNIADALALSAQVYSVPADATTGRVGIAWRVR